MQGSRHSPRKHQHIERIKICLGKQLIHLHGNLMGTGHRRRLIHGNHCHLDARPSAEIHHCQRFYFFITSRKKYTNFRHLYVPFLLKSIF